MKTIFDANEVDKLLLRIENLNANSSKQWGKMTPYQMLRHSVLSEKMFLGVDHYKRLFIGKLFGSMALKGIMKDESPMKKNQPTHPTFKTKGDGSIEEAKKEWVKLLRDYKDKDPMTFEGFVHPFFGKMTKEQIGIYVYKHTDHHLRQFGL